jgi:hypothetical protein
VRDCYGECAAGGGVDEGLLELGVGDGGEESCEEEKEFFQERLFNFGRAEVFCFVRDRFCGHGGPWP